SRSRSRVGRDRAGTTAMGHLWRLAHGRFRDFHARLGGPLHRVRPHLSIPLRRGGGAAPRPVPGGDMTLADVAAAAMLLSLIAYCVLAGADFGGGVWDLLATGPRAEPQRQLVDDAIAPVWEANHVWLILIVVLLFSCFPPAFAAASIALHIPLTLMLLGIVLRGSAFVFRRYGRRGPKPWSRVFAISSAVTPVFLGICLGAVTGTGIRFVNGLPVDGFVRSWLKPFPVAVGIFSLALFAFLAAVYLAVEAPEGPLREDFRRRALVSGVAVGLIALAAALLAGPATGQFRARLMQGAWSWPLQIGTGAAA